MCLFSYWVVNRLPTLFRSPHCGIDSWYKWQRNCKCHGTYSYSATSGQALMIISTRHIKQLGTCYILEDIHLFSKTSLKKKKKNSEKWGGSFQECINGRPYFSAGRPNWQLEIDFIFWEALKAFPT